MHIANTGNATVSVEHRRGEYSISTDPGRIELDVVYEFLTNCYWAKGIPRDVVARSIEHSLCFGIYDGSGTQVGFARVISDFATIAYLGDMFVLESHRGRGLSKWMMECILQPPALQGLRRWILLKRDAHSSIRILVLRRWNRPSGTWSCIGLMYTNSGKHYDKF